MWPRGLRKDAVELDEWNKDVAPSAELRRWFGHDPKKFAEFASRYRDELDTATGRTTLDHLEPTEGTTADAAHSNQGR
jgi:uncharacterized protein YeaO (DUF488 family)